MIRRRALAAGTAATIAAAPALGQPKYYLTGTKERPVRFEGAGGVPLSGTLLLPRISEIQYVPGVVLIAGSGPTDRDGNNPLVPARIDVLKLIAERLAAARIATLRYDKRGIGASAPAPSGIESQERFFAWDNIVADAKAAYGELLRHDEIKPYASAVLGHSEGGLIALAALPAMTWRPPYALVLAASPGLPMREILRRQFVRTAPHLLESALHAMDVIARTGHMPSDVPVALQEWFQPYIGPFLQGALAFDPAQALARLDTACLLLHGAADRQVVPMGDIQPLIDAMGRRRAGSEVLIAGLTSHNLKTVTSAGDPGFTGPLAPAIADRLASWLGYVLSA
jgi:pimeloyl-ACP methyl ester carboxylesterase